MRENLTKEKLKRGELALGTMVFEFASAGLPTILGSTGADFAMYDMEHTGLSLETLRSLVGWSRGVGPTPLVRVPAIDPQFISHALDVGVLGVMAPNVQTVEEARLFVNSTKYPPVGHRGAAFGFAHDDYVRATDVGAHVAALNNRTLLIAQIESVQGLANVDEIAKVEGLDVLWVGHFDLTLSMGIPGHFTDQRFLDAMARVAAACARNGLAAGFNVDHAEGGRYWAARGFRMLAISAEFRLMAGALKAAVDGIRGTS